MKISRSTWIAILVLIVWLVLTWFLGGWIGLKAPVLYYLRGGLWLLGIAGFIGYLLLRPKDAAAPQGGAGTEGALQEIDFNFAEAAKRIQAGAGVKRLGGLPAVFLIGDAGSAKTTIIANCGIEPQLLAGQAFQDNVVAATRAVNLWYARNTLFIDPAGGLMGDAAARRKLFKKFLPVQINSLVGSQTPAARSVVFTVDCDTFLQAGGAEALATKARYFQTVLSELSQELGASFPVYVLFTKADKITYFREYVENLSDQEAGEVFGVTLPVEAGPQGVYAEQQARRLTDSFQQLYYSLADRRPVYLAREHNAASLPNIYEFPREFAKLRPLLVQFLVDLCRPSQFGTSPFLRGFYFSGVRPITMKDVAPAAQMPVAENTGFDSGATRMFSLRDRGAPLAAEARESGVRRIPQWLFVTNLFPGVIFADRTASAMGASNVKLNLARRLMLGAAAGIALLLAAWWTVSYSKNSSLVHEALEAASAVPSTNLPSGQLASADSLQRLTRVKNTLATLNGYQEDGVPLSYGGLLYTGAKIREPLQTIFYALFRRLLLAPTQETLVQIATRPDAYQTQGNSFIYGALKSYLITTDHHEKSTPEFLVPALLLHWKKDQPVDAEREDLARQNFDFYARQLLTQNTYPPITKPDSTAVQNARDYLNKFGQSDSIYQAMLAAAADSRKPIIFNADYPGSAETVINSYKVDPAFAKASFVDFQKQLENPDKYFSGDEWVLGPTSHGGLDKAKMVPDLRAHYQKDFVKTWQDYLRATNVVGYVSVADAAHKLDKLSGPQSALMEAICVASENTAVPVKEVAQAFQPVQVVTPPGCLHQLVGQANNGYMAQLIGLKGALQQITASPDPGLLTNANATAGQAEAAASTVALGFTADPSDPKSTVLAKTAQLLKDPIDRVPPLLKGKAGDPVNAAAANACKSIAPILSKYPFNPQSPVDATLQEVNDFLKPPDGQLWALYNKSLKDLLIPSGDIFVAASGQALTVNPAFLNFFNRAARMSRALYKGDNATAPNFTFTMQPLPAPDVDHINLTIDGGILSTDVKGGAKSQTFAWPGSTPGVELKVNFGSAQFTIASTTGLWAIWRFIDTGERVPGGSGLELQWVTKTTAGPTIINGHPAAVKFSIDPQSAQILRPQYFSGMGCVSTAVH